MIFNITSHLLTWWHNDVTVCNCSQSMTFWFSWLTHKLRMHHITVLNLGHNLIIMSHSFQKKQSFNNVPNMYDSWTEIEICPYIDKVKLAAYWI